MVIIGGGILTGVFLLLGIYKNQRRKLRVLMYHKVEPGHPDLLTVTPGQLEEHLNYLQKGGFTFVSISHYFHRQSLPEKSVLLTFDDAYLSTLENAYPLLKQYEACATVFVPTAYTGKTSLWDIKAEPLLSAEQLGSLDSTVFELGLHSHTHRHYGRLPHDYIQEDLKKNIQFFEDNHLLYCSAFAYPYGGRPRKRKDRIQMQRMMAQLGIRYAFRIGNGINRWPLSKPYEIQRIDIRGTDSLEEFTHKIKYRKKI